MELLSLEIEEVQVEGYEKVLYVRDERSGLKAIICIHNTALGPALGGVRAYPYANFEAALTDAKRLAMGMTYKSAVAGAGLGGGKAVIWCSPQEKTKEKLRSFAEAVNHLQGLYTTAEDVGMTVEDLTLIAESTPYVVGIKHAKSSGNPAPFTAWGVFRGIQASLEKVYGSPSVEGKTIAIQGLGSVGKVLAELLFWHGASLVVSDIDWEKTVRIAGELGAKACPVEDIMTVPCDVYAPCALGGTINGDSIGQLQCRIVAGCANNQLLTIEDGDKLHQRGILYAPDFVINAGGLINVAEEISLKGYSPAVARHRVDRIYDSLLEIFHLADQSGVSTHRAAMAMGEDKIRRKLGKRVEPPCYHHFVGLTAANPRNC